MVRGKKVIWPYLHNVVYDTISFIHMKIIDPPQKNGREHSGEYFIETHKRKEIKAVLSL